MFRRIILYAAAGICGIAAAFACSLVFTTAEVTGSAMEPSVSDGSRVLINRLAYRMNGNLPEVGNLIAFKCDVYSEEGDGGIVVRRVAAGGGDTVEIKDNIFYLNGKPYDDYIQQPAVMEDMSCKRLDEKEIFVLCDDRRFSLDSRDEAVGILEVGECIGRVCFR